VYPLYGKDWIDKWKTKALEYPYELQVMMVKHFLKFHPEWVFEKKGVEKEVTFYSFMKT